MKVIRKHIAQVVEALLTAGAHKAIKYVSPDHVVCACLPAIHRSKRSRSTSIVLTFGKPNFAERKFIKACVKAGELFPVKKIQIKFPPKRHK